jgi:hypothetical protein
VPYHLEVSCDAIIDQDHLSPAVLHPLLMVLTIGRLRPVRAGLDEYRPIASAWMRKSSSESLNFAGRSRYRFVAPGEPLTASMVTGLLLEAATCPTNQPSCPWP